MKKQNKLSHLLSGLIKFSIPAFILAACSGTATKESKQQNDVMKADSIHIADSLKATQAAMIMKMKVDSMAKQTGGAWQYSQKEDEMTSKAIYFAELEATEKIELSAPYDGGSTATLTIRNKDGVNNLILFVSPAQFNSNVVDGENIRIRFDQEQPIVYNCGEPSDGSTTALFINQANSVIAKLKKAKTVLIQAEFYQDGLKEMKFNTEGLVWNHPIK